jgi:hypothetical protein
VVQPRRVYRYDGRSRLEESQVSVVFTDVRPNWRKRPVVEVSSVLVCFAPDEQTHPLSAGRSHMGQIRTHAMQQTQRVTRSLAIALAVSFADQREV